MKLLLVLLSLFFSILCDCGIKASEFEELMGKGTHLWKYVETVEDRDRLSFFKTLYENNLEKQSQGKIPQTLHFIWLGNKPYPSESIQNLQKWIQFHPGWKIKFWTDQVRSLPLPQVEIIPFKEFPLGPLTECYFQSDNFGERSDLLRYSILFTEGGFYIDHDLIPLKSLNEWRERVDFICGLEPLDRSIMSSSVIVGTSLIGSTAHHPILREAMDWLSNEWALLEVRYPGSDSNGVYNRVMHRSKRALDEGIRKKAEDPSYCNLVLPPPYFNEQDFKRGLFAIHLHAQTWVKKSNPEERAIQTLLSRLSSRVDLLSFLLYFLGALNLIAVFYLLFSKKKKEKLG